jgi:hypothetical protein
VPIPAPPPADETFCHLFYTCPVTSGLLNQLANTFLPEIVALHHREKKLLVLWVHRDPQGPVFEPECFVYLHNGIYLVLQAKKNEVVID